MILNNPVHSQCLFWGAAGKTHTMQGPPEDPGVYQRALQELFAATGGNAEHAHAPGGGYISVAMLEIYNDDARDLLADAVTGKAASLDVSGLGAGQLPPGTMPSLPCSSTIFQHTVVSQIMRHLQIAYFGLLYPSSLQNTCCMLAQKWSISCKW